MIDYQDEYYIRGTSIPVEWIEVRGRRFTYFDLPKDRLISVFSTNNDTVHIAFRYIQTEAGEAPDNGFIRDARRDTMEGTFQRVVR